MRRVALATAAILVAVVLQVTVVNRLPFPGGSGPDVVLVLVVSIALAGGPLTGALTGFAAGLALDIAPPGGALLGLSALVFCLVGYGAGKLRAPLERSAWLPLSGVAAGVAAGEVLYSLAGMIFGDPDITLQAMRYVLPAAIVYDLLLSPFVLYGVVRLGRFAEWQGGYAQHGPLTGAELGGAWLAGAGALASGAVVRDTGTGRTPRLREAAGRRADGWIGGHHSQQEPGVWTPRERQLRLRGGVAGSAAGGQAGPPARPARPVHMRFATRRRDGSVNGSARGRPAWGTGRSPSTARLRASAFRSGPSALSGTGGNPASRAPRLRLRHGRRRDGMVGGRAMGNGSTLPGTVATRAGSGGAFHTRRVPGALGRLRPGRGHGATPRFRVSGRGLSGWAGRWPGKGRQGKGRPGWLGGGRNWARRLGGRRGWLGGRRSGLDGRRRGGLGGLGGSGGPGMRRGWLGGGRNWARRLGGRRGWLGGRRSGPGRPRGGPGGPRLGGTAGPGRRRPVWKVGNKGTGGLS